MEAKQKVFDQLLEEADNVLSQATSGGGGGGGGESKGSHSNHPVKAAAFVPLPYQDRQHEMSALAKVGLFLLVCLVLCTLYLYWQNAVLLQSNLELTKRAASFEKLLRKYKPAADDDLL